MTIIIWYIRNDHPWFKVSRRLLTCKSGIEGVKLLGGSGEKAVKDLVLRMENGNRYISSELGLVQGVQIMSITNPTT